MQVKETGYISLKGPLSRNAKLKLLKIGDKISVQVVKRLGEKDALLNLKGNLIKASFNQKIPDDNILKLVLEGINSSKLLFSYENNSYSDHLLSELQSFTLFSIKDFTKYQVKMLDNMLQNGFKDIFSINLFLYELKFKKKMKQDKSYTKAIEFLIKNGVSQDRIIMFSLLFSNIPEMHYVFLRFFYSVFGKKGKFLQEKESFQKLADEIINDEKLIEIMKNFNEKEIIGLFENIFNNEKIKSGKLYFFDNEKKISIDYIINSNYLLFCFELTFLGVIEIIIRSSDRSGMKITIFTESEDKYKILNMDQESLLQKLKTIYTDSVDLNIVNKRKVFEKIIAINKSLQLNSALDLRV